MKVVVAVLGLSLAAFTACSSSDNPPAVSGAPSTSAPFADTGWAESPDPLPDYAAYVSFCCDGDIPESPIIDPIATSPMPGTYASAIVEWTATGSPVLSLSRFRSCDDDAFRNDVNFGCLDPDPEMPHDSAIDGSTSMKVTLDLADPTLSVHIIGHRCAPDGAITTSNWVGNGAALLALADTFDADYTMAIKPLVTDDYLSLDSSLPVSSLPPRFATTCTDPGIAWTDAPGPSILMQMAQAVGYLPTSRPVTDYLWAKALDIETTGTTLYLYAAYSP